MRWRALPLLALAGCTSVTGVDADEGCRQASIALAKQVWQCTDDADASDAADDAFDETYDCRVTGWAGEALAGTSWTTFELSRSVSIAPVDDGDEPTTLDFGATLGCAIEIRARECEAAAAPVDDGSLLALLSCAAILDAPGIDVINGLDRDGDGIAPPLDCDDADPLIYPGAFDVCADGIVVDCDATDEYNCDLDGWSQGDDCDDANPTIYPGAPDLCGDFIDHDCDAADESDCDVDNDGYTVIAGADCNDADPTVYPGAPDVCDGVDRDCDTYDCCVVEGDCDGDGVTADVDCDDRDPSTYPGAPDACHDGIERDCGTVDDFDCDGDGWPYGSGYGFDCDDLDPDINPYEEELRYDKVDSNCNGQLDF
jgi:hypothetical protein